MAAPDPELALFVRPLGAGERACWSELSGGVSCKAWKVEGEAAAFIVKRARPRLAVAADWPAPVRRVLFEARWFEEARRVDPRLAPRPLAVDPERGLIAMGFVEAALWKAELLAGRVDPAFAAEVGTALAAIHARRVSPRRFASARIFHALRIDPYLLETARRVPIAAGPLRELARRTGRARIALTHGDVSPKNILLGPSGPVFLDAETATFGDPAFDVAFCLNHLLLKMMVVPAREALEVSFTALARAHLASVSWEDPAGLEGRAAALLPGLMLARVDGKSPVEYLTSERQKDAVRAFAIPRLAGPPAILAEIAVAWRRSLAAA